MQNGQTAYFNAWPNVNEMHPNFLQSQQLGGTFCFCDPNDGMGNGFQYKVSTGCYSAGPANCPDWRYYARAMTPHASGYNFTMFVEQGGDSVQHVFDIDQFEVYLGAAGNLCWTDTSNVNHCYYGLTGWNNWQVNIRDATKVWFYNDSGGPPGMSRATIRTKY